MRQWQRDAESAWAAAMQKRAFNLASNNSTVHVLTHTDAVLLLKHVETSQVSHAALGHDLSVPFESSLRLFFWVFSVARCFPMLLCSTFQCRIDKDIQYTWLLLREIVFRSRSTGFPSPSMCIRTPTTSKFESMLSPKQTLVTTLKGPAYTSLDRRGSTELALKEAFTGTLKGLLKGTFYIST